MLLRFREWRLKLIGRLVSFLLGAAWTVGTYFVVPVLVVEKLGPVDAFKRSVAIQKKAWGEAAVGSLGVGLITVLVFGALIVPAVLGTLFLPTSTHSPATRVSGD